MNYLHQAITDPPLDSLWGVCNTHLPYRMKKECVKILLRCFLMLKIEFKCFCGTFWGSKWSQNVFAVLFEAQNGVQILLWCFLRLKIESKCFWGFFWGSKSSTNAFAVLFEAQNRVKILLRYFLRLKIESKYFWGAFWGSKWSESIFWGLSFAQYGR